MATRPRSPQEKKALAYHKDHVVEAEYPHGFRRHWPRKKAQSHRAYRRRVHQLLDQVRDIPAGEDDQRGDVQAETVRREQVRKWGVATLREHIDRAYHKRISTTAWNFFKTPYRREEHRSRFAAFLSTITASDSPYLCDVASLFRETLDESASPFHERCYSTSFRYHTWLQAFLDDEPDWELRLGAWIERASADMTRR